MTAGLAPALLSRAEMRGTLVRRVFGGLVDVGVLLLVVLAFPFAILLLGLPIALVVNAVIWVARLL
jgi:hypothetical protein